MVRHCDICGGDSGSGYQYDDISICPECEHKLSQGKTIKKIREEEVE